MTPEERQASHVEMLKGFMDREAGELGYKFDGGYTADNLFPVVPASPASFGGIFPVMDSLEPLEEHRTLRQRLVDVWVVWGYRLDEWRNKRNKKRFIKDLEKALKKNKDNKNSVLTIQALIEWVKEL